ncbi:MAG: DUF4469 domain-containing protein [Tannerella sp.]|jgi:hypothetical protein|nr:DUF4469 domain-containing protein [Tannerella sp.]
MAIDFNAKDINHRIIVKFVPAFLPNAKKKYNAKAVLQTELDIHGIASKADVYNITTSPKVIEEGFNAAMDLIKYLVADGYKIATSLVHLGVRVPGEYDSTETHLPSNIHPEVRIMVDNDFREYIRDNVRVEFDGVEDTNGFIGQITDEATGFIDKVVTMGNIVTLNGVGLKVESDAAHTALAGVFLLDSNQDEIRVTAVALNEPRTLKVLIPTTLQAGNLYTFAIRTQSSMKGSGVLLKELREVRTELNLVAL